MSDKRVLVDTSIWIDYFRRGTSPLDEKLDSLLEGDRVCTCYLIIAELVHGSIDKKEISSLVDYFGSLHWLEENKEYWLEAGMLAFEMKKKGKSVNLADCYLANLAKRQDCFIYSLDKHFRFLEEAGIVELY